MLVEEEARKEDALMVLPYDPRRLEEISRLRSAIAQDRVLPVARGDAGVQVSFCPDAAVSAE